MVIKQPINLTLEELADEVAHLLEYYQLAGTHQDNRVSPVPDARTIRYYTTLGLLDRPRMEGRQARYGKRQVLQLLAIKSMQAHGLPLAEVQARLLGLSDKDIESLLVSLSAGRKDDEEESPVKPTIWREIVLQPGLKILVEEGWSPSTGTSELLNKIKAALEALQ